MSRFYLLFVLLHLVALPAIAEESPPSKETHFQLQPSANLGGAIRLTEGPYETDSTGDLTYSLSIYGEGSDFVAIGLEFQHTGLGREQSDISEYGSVNVTRAANAVWFAVRPSLWHTSWFDSFFKLGIGLGWQTEDAVGTSAPTFIEPATTFSCSASSGGDLAMKMGVGSRVFLSKHVSLHKQVSLDNYRLSDFPLDNCVSGAGSTTTLSIQLGVEYRSDL